MCGVAGNVNHIYRTEIRLQTDGIYYFPGDERYARAVENTQMVCPSSRFTVKDYRIVMWQLKNQGTCLFFLKIRDDVV